MIKQLRNTGTVLALVALAGCSTVNQFLGKEDAIDYKSARASRPSLAVPPDLTQVPANSRYQVPEGAGGSASYSEYATQQARRQASASDPANSAVLPQRSDMRIGRAGDARWLVVKMPADEVYKQALEFWTSQGFSIRSQNPQAGLIETDWAENRANIPQDILRRTIGKIFDQVWDSGERQQFRTRLERSADGTIEVFFSHQHMVEQVVSESQVKWVPGRPDPGLDAAMLSRFMVFLGAEEDLARSELAQAQASDTTAQPAAQVVTGSGAAGSLEIAESFDRAWRRVGLALDRGNFTVEDRDRAAGEYFVRYVDIDAQQQERPGFFSRMFGRGEPEAQPQYRVALADVGGATRVTVLNGSGQPDDSATAKRILDVLLQQLRD